MSEQTEVNQYENEVDIVNKINDNQRASAIDAIQDLLFAKASDAMADYKQVVANTFFDEPTETDRPMKLITETIEDVKILTEERDGKKLLYIEGVFLQSIKNRNGRMYPFEVLNREVERYNEEYVKSNVHWENSVTPMVLLSISIECHIELQTSALKVITSLARHKF